MRAPFKAYVTTNIDPLLSEAASAAGFGTVYCYPTLLLPEIERCKKPVFYMHGHASPGGTPSGDNLVFCRSEFEQAYGEAGVVRNFVVNVLMNYPIVFIGCNLSEPEIHQQFQRVSQMLKQMEIAGAPPPHHRFILAETIVSPINGKRDDGAEEVQVQRFNEVGTSVLRYDPVDPTQQWEVEETLSRLCALMSTVTAGGPGEAEPK
jgi:SIR2-like domain